MVDTNKLVSKLNMLGYTVLDSNDWAISFYKDNKYGFINTTVGDNSLEAKYEFVQLLDNFIITREMVHKQSAYYPTFGFHVRGKSNDLTGRLKRVISTTNRWGAKNTKLLLVYNMGNGKTYVLSHNGRMLKVDLEKDTKWVDNNDCILIQDKANPNTYYIGRRNFGSREAISYSRGIYVTDGELSKLQFIDGLQIKIRNLEFKVKLANQGVE